MGIKTNHQISEYSFNELPDNGHVHHIYPKSFWDENQENESFNRNMLENLIVLSYDEHLGIAHLHGSTSKINEDHIVAILTRQYDKILHFLNQNNDDYSLNNFYKLCCLIFAQKEKNPEDEETTKWYIDNILSAAE